MTDYIDMTDQMIEIVHAEAAPLKTRKEREAFVTGMRAAAKICDVVARQVREENPGRSKGHSSREGEFGATVAESCGDEIMERAKAIMEEKTE